MKQSNTSILIKTKLLAPLDRSDTVFRTRLFEALGSSVSSKLILITAPAGFGKTTFLGQWFVQLKQEKNAPCWLSLDSNDNTPEIFLRYMIASLQQIDKNLGKDSLRYIDNANTSDISGSLNSLLNELIHIDENIYLFLDDFHLINSPHIYQYIELLLNLSPAHVHIVISSRTLPDLPLANMRVKNHLVHLSVEKLRFDFVESEYFLQKYQDLELSDEQIKTLYERCEGWAAGLQLASLSLKETSDREGFITNFSGSVKDITDYLTTAVLNQQAESVKQFLIETAILDRLNAELCNSLLERDDAHHILHNLEANNLFIMPLDHERKWYRYHPIFQEFLLSQLMHNQPQQLSLLNTRASNWFKSQGYWPEAVNYALRANDMPVATELIENRAIEEFLNGRMPRVAAWINQIPLNIRRQHPILMSLHTTALCHMNRADEAELVCNQFEQYIEGMENTGQANTKQLEELRDEAAILRACVSMSQDDVSSVIHYSPKDLHSQHYFMEGVINNVKGYCYYALGDFRQARSYIAEARKAHYQINSSFGIMYSDCFQGMLEYSQGNLKRAQQLFDQSQLGEHTQDYINSVSAIMRGAISYEMNNLDMSLDLLPSNLKILEKVGHISLIQLGYITLAKYYAANNNYDFGLKLLDHLAGLYPSNTINLNHRLLVGDHQIKLLLRDGKRSQALRVASRLEITLDDAIPELPGTWNREVFQKQMIQARLWLVGGQQETSIFVAKRLYGLAEKIGLGYRAIESLILLSHAYFSSGDKVNAVATMKCALEQAAVNDTVRLFLDEGPEILPIVELVQSAIGGQGSLAENICQTIIADFSDGSLSKKSRLQTPNNARGLIEPLSQRELEVLMLMARGQSNAHIADQLNISENTIKWHGRNIFGKLGVSNRTEAVITSQEMGMLATI